MGPRFIAVQFLIIVAIVGGAFFGLRAFVQNDNGWLHTSIYVPRDADAETALARVEGEAGFPVPRIDASALGLELGLATAFPPPEDDAGNDSVRVRLSFYEGPLTDDVEHEEGLQLEVELFEAAAEDPPADTAYYVLGDFTTVSEKLPIDVPGYVLYRFEDPVREENGVGYYLAGEGRVFRIRLWYTAQDQAPPPDEQAMPILRQMATSPSGS
jgi:hypothetical protein